MYLISMFITLLRSVSANGEDTLHNLANGKTEKSKSQKKNSSQKLEKSLHQFQLSMLQVRRPEIMF